MTAIWCVTCGARLEPGLSLRCRACDARRQAEIDAAWREFRGKEPFGYVVEDEPKKRQRGQAVVELALITPLLLAGGLGAADLATMALEQAVAQHGAEVIAEALATGTDLADPAIEHELDRSCRDGAATVTGDPPLVVVTLACPHVSLTSLMPDHITVTASAVVVQEEAP